MYVYNILTLLKNNQTVVLSLLGLQKRNSDAHTVQTPTYIVFSFAYVSFAGLSHVAYCSEMRDTNTAVRERVNSKQKYRENRLQSSKGRFTRELQLRLYSSATYAEFLAT
jgi:hypothetical protein